ncbi:MAG: hypothetical protein VB120_01830 [Lachnospiraceae bacterium]|nr:hypothetical protein [Lachnospiraceae bacterium]
MSKKETEFDRYLRMKKREYEAEVEKKKSFKPDDPKRRITKQKTASAVGGGSKNWLRNYPLDYGHDYDEY